MAISEDSVSYCEYCKGVLLTTKELELNAHESCIDSINEFHNSLASNIEYFRLDQTEYNAIIQLEQLNSYLSDFEENNTKVLNATVYNNRISSIIIDLTHIFNLNDIPIADYYSIFENFHNLMSLTIKKSNYLLLDNMLNIPNRIFFLNISNNNLEKLPLSLFKKPSLRILNLSDNELTDLPLLMNNFKLLNSLHLTNNKLQKLPRFIMNFKKLKTLRLGGNDLTIFPHSLMFLKDLTDLDISNNKITTIPLNIKYLTSLSTFNASNNNIKSISDSFDNLTNLKVVDLSCNEITDVPPSLVKNDKIFSLNLSYNKIKTINKLPNSLTSLNLSDNELTLLPEATFAKLDKLTNINLANNNIQTIPKSLLKLPRLRYLKVNGNPISEPIENNRVTLIY